MARLVVDTNCLLQCISRRSIYHELWISLLDGRNTLCVSTEILEEYAELFQKFTSTEYTYRIHNPILSFQFNTQRS